MNNKTLLVAALIGLSGQLSAANIKLDNIHYRGPVEITSPWITDSTDVKNRKYSESMLLESPVNFKTLPAVKVDSLLIIGSSKPEIHLVSIPIRNERFGEFEIKVDGIKNYKVYSDNKELRGGKTKLKPGLHHITVKMLTEGGITDTVTISCTSPQASYFSNVSSSAKRPFTLRDVMYAEHIGNPRISPSGKYALVTYSKSNPGNRTERKNKLLAMPDGRTITFLPDNWRWMNGEDLLWRVESQQDGTANIVTFNPVSLQETIFAENVPQGNFSISPDERFLFYATYENGPREDEMIYRVIDPEDRQPGYRDRSGIALYDLATGIYRPLTFGSRNVRLLDISPADGKILVMSHRQRFEKRPTGVSSLFEIDPASMKTDTLIWEDGFISGARYSPTGKEILISGSPEALGGIGNTLPEGKIPNMTEGELFIMDLASKDIKAITKDFNPSVGEYTWNKGSGNIYFVAEDKDRKPLFEYNPATGRFAEVPLPEDIVTAFSISENGLEGIAVGESAVNPDALYAFSSGKKTMKVRKLDSTGTRLLEEAQLAEVINWDFVNSKGDTINGRYYLPPNFDPDKSYPMIVNYYGGCSPTSRNFATRYPHHEYANQGYVVYVINPSGATGFGQEFASRHVNTAGKGVAEDIIEGTSKFIEEHPFVNKEKIGCIGASYGGFMTQYLQTVTDLFAAAISHAGISDHTGYWGEGYWGYSYSEVSMAENYPWSNPDLYVKQSPLYNADKINTPILFLHGDEDTNVPPSESIQLFTALKLLGKDTALVEVAGQNHHIMDPEKRQKWQDTIYAWFAKYLQDEPAWWDELYPPLSL